MTSELSHQGKGLRMRLRGVKVLYAYFRGAEYPMGRVRAFYEAVKMVLSGWPRLDLGRGKA